MKLYFKVSSCLIFILSIFFLDTSTVNAESFNDIVLMGGRVMDPETGLDEIRNIGITDGRITAISEKPLKGRTVQDVSGLVVAPGFIDLHAHGQHLIGQQYQVRDGVTTALEMEGGAWPVDNFYRLREGRSLINYGATVSHVCVRIQVMTGEECIDLIEGSVDSEKEFLEKIGNAPFYDPTSKEEMAKVLSGIEKGFKQGGLGVGLAAGYFPGLGRKEVYEIFKQAAELNATVFVHVRKPTIEDQAPGIHIAVAQELFANAAVTGASLQLVHVTSTGGGDTPTILEMIEKAQERGIDITVEAYPYTAASTSIGTSSFDEGWQESWPADYGDLQWSATGERLTEETFRKYRQEQPAGFVIIHFMPEQIVRYAVAHPLVSIASDGIPWQTKGEHPRGAGTFGRVLGKYVREEGALSLMLALRKMTLMPAQRLEEFVPSMKRKGRIQVGADADITVFNPATVIDKATFSKPMQFSSGFEHVLVNGVFVVRNADFVEGVLPGRPILNKFMDNPYAG